MNIFFGPMVSTENRRMANILVLGDKTTAICTLFVCLRHLVRLGLVRGFMVLFFMFRVRLRVSIVIIMNYYVYVLYEKSNYFTYFSVLINGFPWT